MYTVNVQVTGIAPLLAHRYPMPDFADLNSGGHKQTGARDFSNEWRDYFYATASGQLYQPASHFEGAMSKTAGGFKIAGKRGKSYKDLFVGNVFCSPDQILHDLAVPETLDTDPDKRLYLDMRPVVVQRNRVVRLRPAFKAGWQLEFEITVIDDQIPSDIVKDVLDLAGRTVGIGDYRPKFGRFMVTHFEVRK